MQQDLITSQATAKIQPWRALGLSRVVKTHARGILADKQNEGNIMSAANDSHPQPRDGGQVQGTGRTAAGASRSSVSYASQQETNLLSSAMQRPHNPSIAIEVCQNVGYMRQTWKRIERPA